MVGRTTSASSKKVAVSDQAMAETLTVRPGVSRVDRLIFVKGHGPAIQEARALRNSLPSPASSEALAVEAFHLPSGEHCRWAVHGTLPVLTASKARTELPMVTSVAVLIEY